MTGWVETVSVVASAVMSITLLGLAIVLGPAAWSFWRSFRKVRDLLDRVYADVTPLMRHASNIADNLDYVTTAIRTDVQRVNATITSANRRLEDAVARAEARLLEFNALLEVVRDEAEETFVSTASVVRGVRAGAARLATEDEDLDTDEGEHERDDDPDDAALQDEPEGTAPTRPRIRPRRRRRA